jgi:hypothetical protein
MFLRMQARRTVGAMLADIEDPAEQAAILKDALDIIGEKLWPLTGRVDAATSFNSVATDICAVFRLPRAIKNAAAEQAFAKLQRPANEDHANDGGDDV